MFVGYKRQTNYNYVGVDKRMFDVLTPKEERFCREKVGREKDLWED